MKATKLLAVLAIAAILVFGAGTFVLMGGLQSAPSRQIAITHSTVSANVVARPVTSSGTVSVTVLP